jgi:hypothetical protein
VYPKGKENRRFLINRTCVPEISWNSRLESVSYRFTLSCLGYSYEHVTRVLLSRPTSQIVHGNYKLLSGTCQVLYVANVTSTEVFDDDPLPVICKNKSSGLWFVLKYEAFISRDAPKNRALGR